MWLLTSRVVVSESCWDSNELLKPVSYQISDSSEGTDGWGETGVILDLECTVTQDTGHLLTKLRTRRKNWLHTSPESFYA